MRVILTTSGFHFEHKFSFWCLNADCEQDYVQVNVISWFTIFPHFELEAVPKILIYTLLVLGAGLKYVFLHFLYWGGAWNMYSYTFVLGAVPKMCIYTLVFGAGPKIFIHTLLVLRAGPKTGISTLFVLGVGPKICIIHFLVLRAGPQKCIPTLFVFSVNRGGLK